MKRLVLCVVVLILGVTESANATLIDFEGLSLAEGASLPTIGIATFSASIAIEGAPIYAFGGLAGADNGDGFPFNTTGNVFITNPGGFASSETVKTLTIDFSTPVSSLSLFAADIDSGGSVTERLVVEALDGVGGSLATRTIIAPAVSPFGNAVVHSIDFGATANIEQLVFKLDNIDPAMPGFTQLGFGIDNLTFTAATVPEPSTLAIWSLLGLCGFGLSRRRKT
jgi:hypothetical protein